MSWTASLGRAEADTPRRTLETELKSSSRATDAALLELNGSVFGTPPNSFPDGYPDRSRNGLWKRCWEKRANGREHKQPVAAPLSTATAPSWCATMATPTEAGAVDSQTRQVPAACQPTSSRREERRSAGRATGERPRPAPSAEAKATFRIGPPALHLPRPLGFIFDSWRLQQVLDDPLSARIGLAGRPKSNHLSTAHTGEEAVT